MPNFIIHPEHRIEGERPSGYEALTTDAKQALAAHALHDSNANLLLAEKSMGSLLAAFERDRPDAYNWALSGLERAVVTLGVHTTPDTFEFAAGPDAEVSFDAVKAATYIQSILAYHAEKLTSLFDKAIEEPNKHYGLVLNPLDTLAMLISADGFLAEARLLEKKAADVIDPFLATEQIYTFERRNNLTIAEYIQERKQAAVADNSKAPAVDLFAISQPVASYDGSETLSSFLGAMEDTDEDLGIVEWLAANLQGQASADDERVVMPANIFTAKGLRFVTTIELDKESIAYKWSMLPAASKTNKFTHYSILRP